MAVFSNRATLSYNGITTDSNTVTGEIVQLVSADKEALSSTYRTGDVITYVVSIVNGGSVTYPTLTVSDDLGAFSFGTQTLVPLNYVEGSARYYANGVLQPAPTAAPGAPLVFSGITLPANGNAILIYQATVNAFAPLGAGASVVNTATVANTGAEAPAACPLTPISVSATVTAADGALLSIAKALSPTTVTECGEITYTFTISNQGNTPAIATDNVVLSDTFNPPLSDVAVRLDGVLLSEGVDYTYNEGTGIFSTTPGRITVPAATYTQDPVTGERTVTPGVTTLTVVGII